MEQECRTPVKNGVKIGDFNQDIADRTLLNSLKRRGDRQSDHSEAERIQSGRMAGIPPRKTMTISTS